MRNNILIIILGICWSDFKGWACKKYSEASDFFFTYIWHTRHVFAFHVRAYDYGEVDAMPCLLCEKSLAQVNNKKQNFKIFISILCLAVSVHAARFNFDQVSRGFTYDSAGIVRIYIEGTECNAPRTPCLLRVTDGVGEGVSVNVYGRPGDTVDVAPFFARALLPSRTPIATLAFYAADGKELAIQDAPMRFQDPKPTPLRKPQKATTVHATLNHYRIDGRILP